MAAGQSSRRPAPPAAQGRHLSAARGATRQGRGGRGRGAGKSPIALPAAPPHSFGGYRQAWVTPREPAAAAAELAGLLPPPERHRQLLGWGLTVTSILLG